MLEAVGSGTQEGDVGPEGAVCRGESPRDRRARLVEVELVAPSAQRTKGVEYDRYVDELLEQGSPRRRQTPGRRETHREHRQHHADHHALQCDRASPSGDEVCVTKAIETVDGEHDVGRLG